MLTRAVFVPDGLLAEHVYSPSSDRVTDPNLNTPSGDVTTVSWALNHWTAGRGLPSAVHRTSRLLPISAST